MEPMKHLHKKSNNQVGDTLLHNAKLAVTDEMLLLSPHHQASVLVRMIRGGSMGHLELLTRKWIASSVSLWSQRVWGAPGWLVTFTH